MCFLVKLGYSVKHKIGVFLSLFALKNSDGSFVDFDQSSIAANSESSESPQSQQETQKEAQAE